MPLSSPNITRSVSYLGVEYGYEGSTGRFYRRVNGQWVPSAPPPRPPTAALAEEEDSDEEDDDEEEEEESDDEGEDNDDEDEDEDDDDSQEGGESEQNALTARFTQMSMQRSQTDPGTALSQVPPDIRTGYDPRTQVRSVQQYTPQAQFTPSSLANIGVQAYAMIRSGGGNRESEPSDPSYRRRSRPSNFFVAGKVFMILWAEPTNVITTVTAPTGYTPGIHGQPTFQRYRRFIVAFPGQPGQGSCIAVPILTHNGQGVAAQGALKSVYGIVHTGQRPPFPTRAEQPRAGERGMLPYPVRVNPDHRDEVLDPMSRICYGKLYTIEHNLPVRPVGMVHEASKDAFLTQLRACLTARIGMPRNQRGRTNSEVNARPNTQAPNGNGINPPLVNFSLHSNSTNPNGTQNDLPGWIPRTRIGIIASHGDIVEYYIRDGKSPAEAEEKYQAILAGAAR